MNLYLMQHAEAATEDVDVTRPLTARGKNDLRKVTSFLRQAHVKLDEIWCSSKLRSKESADLIAKDLGVEMVIQKEGLGPDDPVDKLLKEIIRGKKTCLLIGHLPYLLKLIFSLLSVTDERALVKFKPGGVVFLENDGFGWQIAWMVVPEVV